MIIIGSHSPPSISGTFFLPKMTPSYYHVFFYYLLRLLCVAAMCMGLFTELWAIAYHSRKVTALALAVIYSQPEVGLMDSFLIQACISASLILNQ